jgi:hypothetical protein
MDLISQRVAKEENRLSVSNPELLDEWDYEKNERFSLETDPEARTLLALKS